MLDQTLGFIGAGVMARAIAAGLVCHELVAPEDVRVSDPSLSAIRSFQTLLPGCRAAENNRQLVQESEIVICAVKPVVIQAVLAELHGMFDQRLLVSVAAGVPLGKLEDWSGSRRLIRVMPNTPCLIGSGATAFVRHSGATDEDAARVDQMFSAVGAAVEVNEFQLDAVTGLSGSGPAYVFQFVQALADGGVLMGLPRTLAQTLAVQTVIGAARMIIETGDHPAELADRVMSPGGTTIHGVEMLEKQGFRSAVISAVRAATERARTMID